MLQIAIASLSVGEEQPFFKFSKPKFVKEQGKEKTYTLAVIDSQDLDTLARTVGWIERFSEDPEPYLLGLAVLGGESEAESVFWYLDGMIGAKKSVNLYIDRPRHRQRVMFVIIPQAHESSLIEPITRKENMN